MQRRLIVMRHAKSAWDTAAESDHARPLNRRGARDAPRIARRLVTLGWIPEHVVSSTAQRTRETWALMEPVFRHAPAETAADETAADERVVDFLQQLYLAGRDELAAALATLPDDVQCVLALGHNPGWENTASWLSGQSLHMTTANAALLQIDAPSWRHAAAAGQQWQLVQLLRPKELDE